jgi:hypothetical protein
MTPEGKVKAEIKAYLDSIGAYYFMPVQMGYGAKTLDFLVCYKGRFIGIEAKREDAEATKYQIQTMRHIAEAGGDALVVAGVNQMSALQYLIGAIDHVTIPHPGLP